MLNKSLRATGWVLIAIGAIVMEFALYEVVGTSLATRGHQNALREQFIQQQDDPVVSPTPSPGASTLPPRPRGSVRGIALLRVPRIKVNIVVVEGVSLSNLARGPGRYPSSSPIGEPGSTAIAGHRTGWGSPFVNMDKMRPGDRIELEKPDGSVYVYRVTRSMIVQPSEVAVLRGNPESTATHQLTLTTCDPKYTSRNRLIVWADLISTEGKT